MYDETAQHRQFRRRQALNEAAKTLTYRSWSELETDVINGRIRLAVIHIPPSDQEKLIRPSPYQGLPPKKP